MLTRREFRRLLFKHFSAQDGTITIQQFYDTGATDFTEQLTPIAAVDPAVDVVFLAGLGSEFPVAVKQAQSADFSILATFLGADGWDRPDLVEIGGMAVEGSFCVNHFYPGGDPERKKSQFSCRILASGKSRANVPRLRALSGYINSKKSIKSLPCAFAFTCLSSLIIFPALSMTTVIRLLMPSGWSVARNSKLSERSVSTRSGKFRSYCSANFLWVSASCTLTPKTCTSCAANRLDSSRSEQTSAVQPLVKSLG